MKNLISMTDFVLEQDLPQPIGRTAGQMVKYGLFLKQKLELWMFVPCNMVDGVWVVLEEPTWQVEWEKGKVYCHNLSEKSREYQEAKDRVLFEGVEYVEAKTESSYSIVRICKSLSTINYPDFWKGKVVEDLIYYNLNLTKSAKKQIGYEY